MGLGMLLKYPSSGKKMPSLVLSATSLAVAGGTGSGTLTCTYDGDGIISASSSNTAVATVSVRDNTVAVTYVAVGSATITVTASETSKYYSASAECAVTCSRTAVTIPTLNSTSVAWVGNSVSPGVNNLNTTLVTQGGTTSANSVGTWTVTWTLKDTSKYCWSDGTVTQKSQNWSTYKGTISFKVYNTVTKVTYTFTGITYGSEFYSIGNKYATNGTSYINFITSNILVYLKITPTIKNSTWLRYDSSLTQRVSKYDVIKNTTYYSKTTG